MRLLPVLALVAVFAAGCGQLEQTGTPASCSAAGLALPLPQHPNIPEELERSRQAIAAAAGACDYDELERLALKRERGGAFTYHYLDARTTPPPARYWRELEEDGHDVLAELVGLLALEPLSSEDVETDAVSDDVTFAWPGRVESDEDWRALVDVYGEETVACFREHGGYSGYRLGFFDDGDWWFFVTEEQATEFDEPGEEPPLVPNCLGLRDD